MLNLMRHPKDINCNNPPCDNLIHFGLWFPCNFFVFRWEGYLQWIPKKYPRVSSLRGWLSFLWEWETPRLYEQEGHLPPPLNRSAWGKAGKASAASAILCNIRRWGLGQGWIWSDLQLLFENCSKAKFLSRLHRI